MQHGVIAHRLDINWLPRLLLLLPSTSNTRLPLAKRFSDSLTQLITRQSQYSEMMMLTPALYVHLSGRDIDGKLVSVYLEKEIKPTKPDFEPAICQAVRRRIPENEVLWNIRYARRR
jgi:hypothetical protein